MAVRTPKRFLRDTLRRVVDRAAVRARPLIPSATLRQALRARVHDSALATLHIPHYWALYVHDGRGPISKINGSLIFFKDPADDPRTNHGTRHPVRAGDIKHLTPTQYRDGLKANRAHFAGGGAPFDAPMIVVKKVKGVDPKPFFSVGMKGYIREAGKIFLKEFDGYIQEIVNDGLHEKATATFGRI